MAINSGLARRLTERRRALLSALGDPQRALKVIHVAGTNGKGSTAAMLAAILHAAGYRTGRFTSPDLEGPHERFWLDGQTIRPEALQALLAEVAPVAQAVAADYPDLPEWRSFDLWCAAAWLWSQRERTDVVVVEAGVGGRADATNVFEAPLVTVVTAIGLDHTAVLGPDLATIAGEKSGIFRPGVPVVTSATGVALDVLYDEATRQRAPLSPVTPLPGLESPQGGWVVDLPDGPGRLALSGRFQLENAAVVLEVVSHLRMRGLAISDEAVRIGLASVEWPGRCEAIADPQGGTWLFDAAHNAAAVEALVASWKTPEVVVIGVQRTKEATAMVRLLSRADRPLVVAPVPDAESWAPEELAPYATGPLHAAASLDEALAIARRLAPDGLRVVTGSIWLVGAARARVRRSG